MVNIKELRKGNWLHWNSNANVIVTRWNEKEIWIERDGVEQPYTLFDDSLQPIPLNDEWLLKLGFYPSSSGSKFFHDSLPGGYVEKNNNNYILQVKTITAVLNGSASIKYVHRLQNMFHSVTKADLEVIK